MSANVKRRTARSFGYLWAQEHGLRPAAYHYRTQIKPLLPPGPVQGYVLDAGCGGGIDAAHLAQEHDEGHVVAVELSREGIRETQMRLRELSNASPVQADLETLPFGEGIFDLVYCYGVLHHLPHPEQGFRELVRVLKPGGLVAIYVYEDFSTRTAGERLLLRLVSAARQLTVRLPRPLLYRLCWLGSPLVFVVFSVPAKWLSRSPATAALSQRIPFRHGRSFFGLCGDLYDRFSAPVERRYSREAVERWCASLNLRDVTVVPRRGWVACGRKA